MRRQFRADGPNRLWLTDLTEHHMGEGKLYLLRDQDVWSNGIVGYYISDRMESQIVIDALESAVARRGVKVTGCVLHSDRGGQGEFNFAALIVGAVDPGLAIARVEPVMGAEQRPPLVLYPVPALPEEDLLHH